MKQLGIFLTVIFCLTLTVNNLQAIEIADNFQSPVDERFGIIQIFGNTYSQGYCSADTYEITYSSNNCPGTWMYGHTGEDKNISGNADCGANIYNIANGSIVLVWEDPYPGKRSGHGNMLRIKHVSQDGRVIYSQHGHGQAKSFEVTQGQKVSIDEILMLIGTTGKSYGCHDHFEIKYINTNGPGYVYSDTLQLADYENPSWFISTFQTHSDFPAIGWGVDSINGQGPSEAPFWTSAISENKGFDSRRFKLTYRELKLKDSYMWASTYVHKDFNTHIQDICKHYVDVSEHDHRNCREGQDAILMHNPDSGSVYLLKDGFWGL